MSSAPPIAVAFRGRGCYYDAGYISVLCGLNRGTLENIRFEDRASMPEMNLYPNENDRIYIGLACAYNEGTISGVRMFITNLVYRTFDKDTAADVGLVCGFQTADAVLEDVSLEECYADLDAFGEDIMLIAPAVNAGLLVGEAEGGTTVRGAITVRDCSVNADVEDSRFSFSLAPWFDGSTLYASSVLGYVCGDAAFRSVQADCGVDEFTGDSKAHSLLAVTGATYYLAGFVGAAEGEVTAEGCVIDVLWNVTGGVATLHGAEETDGLYNPV